jgi:hypothetical protein
MGRQYRLENDHIFPFSRLKKAGYGMESRVKYALAQELTNRCILTQVANRTKSDKDPAVYLASVQAKFPKALALQIIPTDPDLWRIENYDRFLAARRKLLAGELNDFLKGITASGEATSPASVEDLIAEGESDELEFKSSIRWDYKHECVSKKLEDVILKSVAAFANGQGGTLLIGVDDEGAALGLERDYTALGGVDRDKFELHLRNLFNQAFGQSFVINKLQVSFPSVAGIEICQIVVAQAQQPLIVRVADKNGHQVEKFFVRSGNSSLEMPLSEMHAYISDRFA